MISSYEFVPDLINNENKYSTKLKDRVKVNEIFNEIDISANNNLKKFIQMSHKRYKNIKSGIPINNFLLKQKGEYDELSNKILTNNLYNSNDVENEVQKLYKKVGTKERNALFKIRRSIINNSKNLTQGEILLRRKYEDKINQSKGTNQDDINAKNKEIQNLENFLNNEKNLSLDDKKKYLTNILEKDSNFLNKNIQIYKEFLKDIEKTEDSAKILKIMNKNDDLGHKYNFKINNIKFLSFKEDVEKKVAKKRQEEKFDFKKLAQYTRHGNKKWFEKQLKEKSIKRMNSLKFHIKNKIPEFDHNYSKNNSNSCTKMDFNKTYKSSININNSISNNTLYDSNNITGFNKTIFGNFRNTIKTVKSEAEFIKNINQNFDIKRKTMNKFMKSCSLPSIEDYDRLTAVDSNKNRKKNSKKNSIILSKIEDSNKDGFFEFNFVNNKDAKEKDSHDIMDIYKSTFYNKMQGWTKEQRKKKEKKEMDKISREKNRKFINELRNIKRKPNLFVDVYSLRDGVINEKIKLLNNSLNVPIYSKDMRLNIINDFNNYMESKEKERLLNEEMMRKKQIEEEELIKGQDEHYQLMQKMKKNLNLENKINKEENEIKFDYKYSSSINNNKSNDKNIAKEAFNEYLTILNKAKNKRAHNKEYITSEDD